MFTNIISNFFCQNGGQVLSGGNNFPLRGNKVVMGSGYYKRWVSVGVGTKILGFSSGFGVFCMPK